MSQLCNLCPRRCNVDRSINNGFCGVKDEIILAKAALHRWEEPCISVNNGAGAIFFSGCNLHCCFCQNHIISNDIFGKSVSIEHLADIMLSLQQKGADNIELVTPTHFILKIIKALDMVKHKINIPIIYNSSGYELTTTIDLLKGYIDIYLPDIKYYSPEVSLRYSSAYNYFKYASTAILNMIDQTGKLEFSENGALIRGTIIRHLVLPGLRHDSMKIIDWIAANTPVNSVLVSIMSQYTPFDFISNEYAEIKRNITKMEYNSVIKHAANLPINGFTQLKNSASEKYVPYFDLSGL